MVKPTPSRFNPELLAREANTYSVNLPLSQFSRLQELLQNEAGEMHATFSFSQIKKTVKVAGTLTTSYTMTCQRCLEPVQHEVEEEFELSFAKTEAEAFEMDDGIDPVILDDNGQIHVVDLFEDELILYLPTVPLHQQVKDCAASEHVFTAEELEKRSAEALEQNEQGSKEVSGTTGKKKNPFDVLKNLDLN